MFTMLHGERAARLRVITALLACAFPFATPARAQDTSNPCEQFGMSAATFVARVGTQISRRFTVAPDVPIATLPVYPAAVERGFHGVETGSTIYLQALPWNLRLHDGELYLIYGAFNMGASREVVTPMRAIPIDDAGADLAFLTSQG